MRTRSLLLLPLVLASLPAAAELTPCYGASLELGGGWAQTQVPHGVFEMAPEAFGLLGSDRLRLGVVVQLRTAGFSTAEPSLGLLAEIPTGEELGALVAVTAGYAWRSGGVDGPLVAASVRYGLLHLHQRWLTSSTVYVGVRHDLAASQENQVTAGVALGGGLLDLLLRTGVGLGT